MSEPEPAIARGRSFLGELISMAQTRLEMLSLEIEREKLWILGALRAAFLMAICAWLAGFTLILWMALSLPPGIRSVVMGSVFVALLIATLGGWIALKRSIRRHAPFSRLISQLRLDRASLGQGP
jgi:uncharacterized membrane protein YqjE